MHLGQSDKKTKGRSNGPKGKAMQPNNNIFTTPPANTQMLGLVFDRDHAPTAAEIGQFTPNAGVRALIEAWRLSARAEFLVVAGALHREGGGAVGGLACDWPSAMRLFAIACDRLDDIAGSSGDFSSAWFLALSCEKRDELRAVIAQAQRTAGTA
jgi:hypothetical protein